MPGTLKYAVLASGGGSNFQALLDTAQKGILPAEAVFVASNNSGAGALVRARENHIPAYHLSTRTEGSEEAVATRLMGLLDQYQPDLIVLAGYMKKVPDALLKRMKNRIINIHPALLPEFGGAGMYGHHVHDAVVHARKEFSGVTIHMVNEHYDEGQIVLQRRVKIAPSEDASDVGHRVLALEHDSYWRVLKGFAEGDIVPTESSSPANAVSISTAWGAHMRALEGTVIP